MSESSLTLSPYPYHTPTTACLSHRQSTLPHDPAAEAPEAPCSMCAHPLIVDQRTGHTHKNTRQRNLSVIKKQVTQHKHGCGCLRLRRGISAGPPTPHEARHTTATPDPNPTQYLSHRHLSLNKRQKMRPPLPHLWYHTTASRELPPEDHSLGRTMITAISQSPNQICLSYGRRTWRQQDFGLTRGGKPGQDLRIRRAGVQWRRRADGADCAERAQREQQGSFGIQSMHVQSKHDLQM